MVLGKSNLRRLLACGDINMHDDHGHDDSFWAEWLKFIRPRYRDDKYMGGTERAIFDARERELQPKALQPASIDLRCGNEWMIPKINASYRDSIDPKELFGKFSYEFTDTKVPVDYDTVVADSYLIPAHGFVLVRTREVIGVSESLFAKVEGRSSVGRLGVIVETAGVVDPGFYGSITLEFFNCLPNPQRVYANVRCCQLVVSGVDGDTEGGYQSSKYQGQVATTGSLFHRDFETDKLN